MAVPVLPNSSNFLGVALVINRSRDGPRFVFHYPPHIPAVNERPSGSGDGADGEDLNDDDALLDRISPSPMATAAKGTDLAGWNHDDHLVTENGSQIVPWEHVGGFPTRDLENMLTPARAYHKKLFSVSLDQLWAASYPIYVPENGLWKKTRKNQARSRPSVSTRAGGAADEGTASFRNADSPMMAANIPMIETHDTADEMTAGDAEEAQDDGGATADEKKSGMTMFNLVLILNPKKHEAKELVDMLYFHILRKINKFYKYAQQRSDFVWKESKRILQLKEKGREEKTKMSALWREILDTSSLAASMQDVYEAVCANKIAALQLETPQGTITHSVQIPIPFHIPDLPSPTDAESERLQGLWITTANSFAEDDAAMTAVDDPTFLDKTFALLLLQDEKKIIAELQADPDETTNAMIEFVRLSKPTASFHSISQGPSPLSSAQVRRYAQHFIFWRRAIAIPPLHARDVYILSPNSKMSSLPRASQAWARAFPLAPPLPSFLAELSTAPRPYKWFAPSKPHRPHYLQMLAWLMRGGWVTQLRSFAYVVVWPEIQYEVEYQIEADDIRSSALVLEERPTTQSSSSDDSEGVGRAQMNSSQTLESSIVDGLSSDVDREGGTGSAQERKSRTSSPARDDYDGGGILSPLSPLSTDLDQSITSLPPLPTPEAQNPNETIAEAARLTRLADRVTRAHAERVAQHARKQPPIATSRPSLNTAAHLAHLSPYIIVDAKKATGKESMYLSAIGRRFKDTRVRASWPVFWKYFNGNSALERIALMEDMKRKEVWGLLGGMAEYLITVRHW
ncbi:nitrogen permease regulator of amino acid transport activity 3-domain-containing protein [Xylariales sp. PMI_506]|nr:nitrogen permease regulator of amino acid transport activity 3-domain-containing protein [Xylariales sp. PMI_506]